jgi:hypothetical protein
MTPEARGRSVVKGRERGAGTERVRRAEERADVPGVRDMPERERRRAHASRQVVAAVDADDTRRMRERRDLRQQLGRDRLARPAAEGGKSRPGGGGFAAVASSRDQQLDRLEPGHVRRLDEVLSLRDEQPELVAPAPVTELADELEPLVVA